MSEINFQALPLPYDLQLKIAYHYYDNMFSGPRGPNTRSRMGCDATYNELRRSLPHLRPTFKELHHKCIAQYNVVPNMQFNLLKDCPEDATCDCGRMHDIEPTDPQVIHALETPHFIERLFQNCLNFYQCDALYNLFRKCGQNVVHLRALRKESYNRMYPGQIDWSRMMNCAENSENPLTPDEQHELNIYEKNYPNSARLLELYSRCNCGNYHYGSGIYRALQRSLGSDRIQQYMAGKRKTMRKSRTRRKSIRKNII
jgi:hypothetical protein